MAIIGGGIIGCWTAYFLSRRERSVVVLDRGLVGAQASGVNFGNLRLQGQSMTELPLGLRAQGLWERLDELIGDNCEYSATGNLRLALDETHVAVMESHADEARTLGLEIELIDKKLLRRWPWLGEGVIAAAFSARDATANPRIVTPAVARAARGLGADIRQGQTVVDMKSGNGKFTLRTTEGVTVRAPVLVNAAGAWADALARRFGETVPLDPAAPPELVTEPVPYFIGPTVQAADNRVVARQIPRGNVIVAGHPRGVVDDSRDRVQVEPEKTMRNIRRLLGVIPSLRPYNIIRVWSGIEGYLPDMRPIIGASATTPGLFHAFGFSGHGFQMSPAVGQVLGDLIADGDAGICLEPFRIDRFGD